MKRARPSALAVRAFEKHREVHGNYDHYAGIVSLHGFARLATETGDADLLAEAGAQLAPFVAGERSFHANFPNYLCGGNATAWMFHRGQLLHAGAPLRRYAEQLLNEAPRDHDGILCHPGEPAAEKIWIDVAFAVTPFLLFAGLALKEEVWVDEAFEQTRKMFVLFKDARTGLLRQSRGFNGRGNFSDDNWARGNGWGIYALTELALHLPADHRHRVESIRLYRELVDACLETQSRSEGLWHQEMSDANKPRASYIETSGSALILYAIGAGLQGGLLRDPNYREAFERGLNSLLAYVSEDADVYHTCRGCLCPGKGTKLEYRAMPPLVNDAHAFGPLILAMGQAHLLGIRQLGRA